MIRVYLFILSHNQSHSQLSSIKMPECAPNICLDSFCNVNSNQKRLKEKHTHTHKRKKEKIVRVRDTYRV